MNTFKKLFIGSIALIAVYFGLIIVFQSGLIGSSARKIDGIEEKGISFEELTIPEDIKVVGIGEATHGNSEFQTAKLLMLQKQVETGLCRSIAFEMTPGEAAEINDAIHDPDSDLEELVGKTNYQIYDTEQMLELYTWMRDYNMDKTYEESIMFYGVDMQGPDREIAYLSGFAEEHPDIIDESEKTQIDEIIASTQNYDYSSVDASRDFFEGLAERLLSENDFDSKYVGILTNSIVQWIDAPSFEERPNDYGEHRDLCMANNLKSEYDLEVERGYSQIIITAHSGHVMKGSALSYGETAMGAQIDKIFEGSYFVVGTEFYNATVNIHTAGTYDEEYERKDHDYCSEDILAYQAKYFDGDCYCLDFTKLTEEDGKVYSLVHKPNFMGMAGEGWSVYMDFNKTYHTKLIQADRFDAVIYYYNVTPIRTLHN